MCLENCLMIGIMMPFGVSCLSTQPVNREKNRPRLCKKEIKSNKSLSFCPGRLLVRPLPFKAVQSCSRQSELRHVYRFVTRGTFVTTSAPAEQPFRAPA